jgi:two-component sensor histidine kinase
MKKRLTFVAVAALVPVVALLAYNEFTARNAVEAQVRERALDANKQAAAEFDRLFDGLRALLSATSALPSVQDAAGVETACRETLASFIKGVPWIRSILVLDLQGKLRCDSVGTAAGTDFSDRPFFRDALASGRFVIGEYAMSKLSGSPVLPVAMPLLNAAGETIGVLATAIRLDWLNAQLRERGVGAKDALTIADRNGTILARTPYSDRFVGTVIPDAYRSLVTRDGPGTLELISQDGTRRIIGYKPVSIAPEGVYISSGLSRDEAFSTVDRQTLAGIASILIGTVIALLAAWLAGGLIRRPLARISEVIASWKSGGRARTGLRGRNGDVEAVGQALDEMLDELEQRAAQTQRAEAQRDLMMRELTHRVKNTLALVQSIAYQTFGRSDPELVRTFSSRLVSLSSAYDVLLGEQFVGGTIEAVLRAAIRPHQASPESFRLDGPTVVLGPQTALALSLVTHELATNATKYGALSRAGGSVTIGWTEADGRVSLAWQEHDGPPVAVPKTEGFGSKLIKRAFSTDPEAQVEMSFLMTGLRCAMSFTSAPPSELLERDAA